MIAFPTDFLSRSEQDITKEIRWIDAAPAGQATFVEGAFTYESRQTVEAAFQTSGQHQLLEFVEFLSGEAFFVAFSFDQWDNKTLTVPSDGKVNDLVFSAADPDDSGRPIRIRFGPKPNDLVAVAQRMRLQLRPQALVASYLPASRPTNS